MACRVDVCALVAVLVVLVALLLFAARGGFACGSFRGESLTIWPIKWEARDN